MIQLLLSMLVSLNVFAADYICSFKNKIVEDVFKSEIEILKLNNGRYEISGDDGTNPFDCFFQRSNLLSDTYTCEGYQGAYYAKIYFPKNVTSLRKLEFNYVDENTRQIIRSETLNCVGR